MRPKETGDTPSQRTKFMTKYSALIALASSSLVLGGCVSTAASVVKAPFKAVGQAADWATTSQDEADRNLGRKMRKQQEEEGKAIRRCQKNPYREECAELRQKGLLPTDGQTAQPY